MENVKAAAASATEYGKGIFNKLSTRFQQMQVGQEGHQQQQQQQAMPTMGGIFSSTFGGAQPSSQPHTTASAAPQRTNSGRMAPQLPHADRYRSASRGGAAGNSNHLMSSASSNDKADLSLQDHEQAPAVPARTTSSSSIDHHNNNNGSKPEAVAVPVLTDAAETKDSPAATGQASAPSSQPQFQSIAVAHSDSDSDVRYPAAIPTHTQREKVPD